MEREHDTLQELFEDVVRYAPNGKPAKQIAAEVGKTVQVLTNESKVDYPSHKLGVEMVEPIMKSAGAGPLVARHIARVAGGVFVDLAKVRDLPERPAGAVMDLSLEAMEEYGLVARDIRSAIGNGRISRADLKRITHSVWELIQTLVALDLAAKVAAGVKP